MWRYGRGGWLGPWPGRGPFSYLPPWQRPGWVFGRGACWYLWSNPWSYSTYPTSAYPTPTPEQELSLLENYKKTLETELKMLEERINSLKGQLGGKPEGQ